MSRCRPVHALKKDRRIVCCLSRPDRAPRCILWSRGGVYNVFLVAEDLVPHQSLLNTKQQRLMWTDWIPTHSSQIPSQEVRILVFLFVKPSREVWQTCYLVLFAVFMTLWILWTVLTLTSRGSKTYNMSKTHIKHRLSIGILTNKERNCYSRIYGISRCGEQCFTLTTKNKWYPKVKFMYPLCQWH